MTTPVNVNASFRSHLEELERSGLLLRIRREVDPKFEAAALIKKAAGADKAILFEKVKGSPHRVAANVAGNRRMIAQSLSLDEKLLLPGATERLGGAPELTLIARPPVQEEVETTPKAVEKLPSLTYFERDAGRYITSAIVIAKDPETGYRNSSFNRMMIRQDSKLGIRMMPPQHLGMIQGRSEKRKENLEVAVVIGNHPAEMLASAAPLPFGQDHLALASSIRGAPLRIAKCISSDVEVPADAEVVIEGEVEAYVREEEGPFGEFMDYYVEKGKNHVLDVKAVTHRSDYIYQGLLCGSKEDMGLLAFDRELLLYRALREAGYDVRDVSLMPFIFNGAISLRKRFDGEPKNALMAAFGAYSWLKYCVVVDDDVDVHNLSDVWWALATRSRPDKGTVALSGAVGFPRKDKSGFHRGKLGIDATVPLSMKAEFERKKIPGEDKVDLSDYLR